MITKEQIFKSLAHAWPNSPYSLPNNYIDFDSEVIWHDDQSAHPTLAQIETYYKTIEYIDKRVAEYPGILEQFDLLYNLGYEGWKTEIKKVKDKHPKPSI